MIPNFALSLSFDGIALLHRVPDGWDLVGEVPLDSGDLKTALADLRRKALRIVPEGLRTKLVIPGDQIRFMSLDTDQATRSDVEAALEGKTPYALNELVIDFTRHGGRTHVAAVARETLEEAESFARDHGFDPVACVAVPEDGTFGTEIFLAALGGSGAVRDDRPVRRTGAVGDAAEDVANTGEDGTAPPVKAEEPSGSEVSRAVQTTGSGAAAAVTSQDEAKAEETARDRANADAPGPADAMIDERGPADAQADPVRAPMFASRSKGAAPALNGATKGVSSAAMAGAAVPGASAPSDLRKGAPGPRFTPDIAASRGSVADAASPSSAKAAPAVTGSDARPRIAPDVPSRTSAAAGVGLPGGQPIPAPATEPLFTRRKEPPPPLVGKGRAASDVALRANGHSDAPVSALTAAARPPEAPVQPVAAPVARAPEVAPMVAPERQGRVASRSADPAPAPARSPRGRPRYLGLILTAILLIVLLLIGLWAATLPPGGIAGWFDGASDEAEVAVAETEGPAVAESAAATPETETPTATAAAVVTPAAVMIQPTVTEAAATPAPRAPAGRVLTPDEANRIYAATGVYQRAPRIAVTPRSATLEGVGPVATVAAAPVVPQPLMPTLAAAEPDALIAAQPAPPGPDETFARDARGNILATAEGTLTPQGAVVFAGAPDLRPRLRPGTPVPTPAAAATPPVAPVARPEGLVPAEEAATAAPPLRPVLRPQSAAATTSAAAEPAAEAPLPPYTGTRPKLRPAALVPEAAVAIAAYTGTRPVLRPAGIAPPAPEEEAEAGEVVEEVAPEPVADISAVAAAIAAAAPRSTFQNRTALAVSVIPRPAPRPRNFAQVVARTRTVAPPPAAAAPSRAAAIAPKPAAPVAPTIVAPSGNVPGGVARAATVDNAMNMRQMNLVGVYGKPNARRALVRLGNGRYVKVEVGSRLDGGQVTAIGDTALNFVKRGKTYALTLPG